MVECYITKWSQPWPCWAPYVVRVASQNEHRVCLIMHATTCLARSTLQLWGFQKLATTPSKLNLPILTLVSTNTLHNIFWMKINNFFLTSFIMWLRFNSFAQYAQVSKSHNHNLALFKIGHIFLWSRWFVINRF
jgi:hypothetical protein